MHVVFIYKLTLRMDLKDYRGLNVAGRKLSYEAIPITTSLKFLAFTWGLTENICRFNPNKTTALKD